MVIADAKSRVDTRAFCTFEGIPSDIDVFLHSTCQTTDGCSVNDSRDAPNGFKVAGRGDRKACFDDVDAKALELAGDFKFFIYMQRRSGRLLAIPQRRVKDMHMPAHD
jgi:hypothetical protein